MAEIHQAAKGGTYAADSISDTADIYYDQQKKKIADQTCLAVMEGYPINMWNYRDDAIKRIEAIKEPPKPTEIEKPQQRKEPAVQKKYKPIFRQSLLKVAKLESDAEIDEYVDKLRDQLKTLLKGSDGIELK